MNGASFGSGTENDPARTLADFRTQLSLQLRLSTEGRPLEDLIQRVANPASWSDAAEALVAIVTTVATPSQHGDFFQAINERHEPDFFAKIAAIADHQHGQQFLNNAITLLPLEDLKAWQGLLKVMPNVAVETINEANRQKIVAGVVEQLRHEHGDRALVESMVPFIRDFRIEPELVTTMKGEYARFGDMALQYRGGQPASPPTEAYAGLLRLLELVDNSCVEVVASYVARLAARTVDHALVGTVKDLVKNVGGRNLRRITDAEARKLSSAALTAVGTIAGATRSNDAMSLLGLVAAIGIQGRSPENAAALTRLYRQESDREVAAKLEELGAIHSSEFTAPRPKLGLWARVRSRLWG